MVIFLAGEGEGEFFLFLFLYKDKSRNLSKIVSVLLSASVERVGVSRMRDFKKKNMLSTLILAILPLNAST